MRSGNDMVDAFMYSMQALKYQRARREKRHRLMMWMLTIVAILMGAVIGWTTG